MFPGFSFLINYLNFNLLLEIAFKELDLQRIPAELDTEIKEISRKGKENKSRGGAMCILNLFLNNN
jgi:hypothetical protein